MKNNKARKLPVASKEQQLRYALLIRACSRLPLPWSMQGNVTVFGPESPAKTLMFSLIDAGVSYPDVDEKQLAGEALLQCFGSIGSERNVKQGPKSV